MPNSNSFDDLIHKALQSQDFPPLPESILNAWQAPRSELAAKWLWILPSVVFILGIGIGVELAPLGLTNAFSAMKNTLLSLGRAIPADAWKWAFALLLGVVAFSIDSVRDILARLK
jgi:hypothetical protein